MWCMPPQDEATWRWQSPSAQQGELISSRTVEELAALLADRTQRWSTEQRRSLLNALMVAKARRDIVLASDHPAQLAQRCDPTYVVTPAIDLVSRSVERVLREPHRHLLVTAPPQELKSTLCAIWTPLRALQLHPDWNIMVLTFADSLAEAHSFTMRQLIENYGTGAIDTFTGAALPDKLGISLMRERNAVGRWRIKEGKGGLVAAGLRATVTGLPANLIIIDDPYKGPQEADSAATRQHILDIFRSVVRTRLAPGGSMILIQTRWHPEDLAGTVLKDQADRPPAQRTWRYLNIPAFSHPGVPDALNRPAPGMWLESARGRTAEEFEETRKVLGERFWFAMYMGVPTPPEGGLFVREWFERAEVEHAPGLPMASVVAVDPAETGENDEAGVIAGSIMRDGTVVLTKDRSGHMTSDQWAVAAVDLAVETGASEIWVEAYTAGTTYVNVVKRAITAKLKELTGWPTDTAEQCMELFQTKAVLTGIRVQQWRGTGDAVARSALLRQAVEVGTCRVVKNKMTTMVDQAVVWQVGQHQPDRVAASVIAHAVLAALLSRKSDLASPLTSARNGRDTGWLSRSVS
jgi:hypothetical protein